MNKYQIEYASDGCPNDCGYCRDLGLPCVYGEEIEQRLRILTEVKEDE